jgi:hypothetical protein
MRRSTSKPTAPKPEQIVTYTVDPDGSVRIYRNGGISVVLNFDRLPGEMTRQSSDDADNLE